MLRRVLTRWRATAEHRPRVWTDLGDSEHAASAVRVLGRPAADAGSEQACWRAVVAAAGEPDPAGLAAARAQWAAQARPSSYCEADLWAEVPGTGAGRVA